MGLINECLTARENPSTNLITHNNYNRNIQKLKYSESTQKIIHFQENINKKKKQLNSEKAIHNQNRQKIIDILSALELTDEISEILRIRIPFFSSKPLQSLSVISFLTGNGPYHEGLVILTKYKKIYITQTYPITFIKVNSINEGISEIISFNTYNKNSKKFFISDIYIPHQTINVMNVYSLVKIYPNKYDILGQNCQKFCNDIIISLAKRFKIERDSDPDSNKKRFSKIKMLFPDRINKSKVVLRKIHINDTFSSCSGKKYYSYWNDEKRSKFRSSVDGVNLMKQSFM